MINILTPEQLGNVPNNIIDLYTELEEFILKDAARRIKKAASITSTAEWQKNQAELLGMRNIDNKIASILKLSDEQIESLFPNVALASFKAEMTIYEHAKLNTIDYNSKAIQDYVKTAIKLTKGDIENITQSLGFAEVQNGKVVYSSTAKFYQKELNIAHLKVKSGAIDYNTAIKQATRKFAESGLRTIDYANGYSINIDSATRRAVLTGVHQMNQEMTNYNAREIIKDEDDIYYEVTAHAGARTGIGINNHAAWQGKVYKYKGSEPDYPNLKESTGLGDMLGLSGINCKHSYFIFIPHASVRTYTDKQLENIDPPPKSYKDKEYTYYEATQYQRKIENEIRKLKRENIIYKETRLDADVKINNSKMNALRREYKQFSEEMGIKSKLNRTMI